MKTKEAIWLIEDLRDDYYEIDEYCEMVNDFDQVIFLLQQGEKYKKMWGEMKVYFSPPAFRYPIEKLEQKYLKEANPNEADNK